MATVDADGSSQQEIQSPLHGLKVGICLTLSLHTSNEPRELSQCMYARNGSTINAGIDIIIIIIRPHRSTTYVDAAYSYRLSSVVCRSVTLVSPAKTAAPIELQFGLRTWVGPGELCIRWGPDPPMGRGKFFGGEWAFHCKV